MVELQTLGIIGTGCIGRRIAQAAQQGELGFKLVVVFDLDVPAAQRLKADYAPDAVITDDLASLVSECDVVVECAAGEAVPSIIEAVRFSCEHHGRPRDVLVMSVGGLLDVEHLDQTNGGPVIHVPAGALGGLDAIQAMAVAGLDEVTLTTRKPPAGLGLDIDSEQVLFEGTAADVINKYPKNVNVAIALSFAGIGPVRTQVKLIADPKVTRNTHQVSARGAAGEIRFESSNLPFPENPRTSYLAALSAIAVLKRMTANLRVG